MKAAGRHSSPQLSVRYRQLNPLWVLSLLSAYLMGTAFRLQFSTERKKNKSKHWSPQCRCSRSCPSAPTSLVEKWMGSQSHVKHPPDLTSHLNTWASHQNFFNHQQREFLQPLFGMFPPQWDELHAEVPTSLCILQKENQQPALTAVHCLQMPALGQLHPILISFALSNVPGWKNALCPKRSMNCLPCHACDPHTLSYFVRQVVFS